MTVRKGKPAKGPAGLCLTDEERDRLPERVLTKYCRLVRLVVRSGSRGCT